MHIGLVMECYYRDGLTQNEAFDEAFATANLAENLGFDGAWLAELHFATPVGSSGGLPSIVSSPLILATAIAHRTERIRVAIGVLVLPLGHPIRMAEEVATIDNVTKGRFDLGVGRSGFARAYEGYNLPYSESRPRFLEYLEIMRLAWTQESFSYHGEVYNFDNVSVMPRPYQNPHPPLWTAATTKESFPLMGSLGLNLLVGLRGMTVHDLAEAIKLYHSAWQDAGHEGTGQVMLRIPIYVADSMDRAVADPEDSAMHAYARLGRAFADSAGRETAPAIEERAQRAASLSTITYEDLLRDRFAFGTPDSVTDRLLQLKSDLGLSGFIMESNVGGRIPREQVTSSLQLFGTEVVPNLK